MKNFIFDIQRFVETITGTEGHDNISVTASQQFINAHGGNDTVFNAFYNNYQGTNYGFVTISGDGNDWVSVVGSNATISGDDVVYVRNNSNSINGGSGDDNIVGEGLNITILSVSGSDYAFIEGGSGDDTVLAIGSPQNLTINGGYGNDSISLDSGLSALIYVNSSDDNDIVYGFDENDTLHLVGSSYFTLASENNVIVNNGQDKVTLVGSTGNTLNIILEKSQYNPAPTFQPTPTIQPNPTTTSINYIIQKSNNIYTYSGGNRTVKIYQSNEMIKLFTNYAGIGLEGDTFYINSSSERLAIEDARDKVIEYNTNGNGFAKYSYIASGSGFLDGTWMNQRSMIVGADNSNNQIAAGAGGLSMRGGNGGYGNDLLIGGTGYDEFFYSPGDGNDSVRSFGSNDLMNLDTLPGKNISAFHFENKTFTMPFNDGGSLSVESQTQSNYWIDGHIMIVDHRRFYPLTYSQRSEVSSITINLVEEVGGFYPYSTVFKIFLSISAGIFRQLVFIFL